VKSTDATGPSEWPDNAACPVLATQLVNWSEVAAVIETLSLKWALPVLMGLGYGAMRHSELSHALRIDNKQLSRILRRLQEAHIVARSASASRGPVQVRYHLTPSGRNLVAILAELGDWRRDGQDEMVPGRADVDPALRRSMRST